MKRFIAIGLMALTMFSISAFANGPLLGVSFVPTVNSMFNLSAGWDFGQVNIEASKTNLATLGGDWTFSTLWTPARDTFEYRVGADVTLRYNTVGTLQYRGLGFVVGASKSWGPIQVYGQLNLSPSASLGIAPRVGVNFLFGDMIPPDINL